MKKAVKKDVRQQMFSETPEQVKREDGSLPSWVKRERAYIKRRVVTANAFSTVFYMFTVLFCIVGAINLCWMNIRNIGLYYKFGEDSDIILFFLNLLTGLCSWTFPICACLAFRRGEEDRIRAGWLALAILLKLISLGIYFYQLFTSNYSFEWSDVWYMVEDICLPLLPFVAMILLHATRAFESRDKRVQRRENGKIHVAVSLFCFLYTSFALTQNIMNVVYICLAEQGIYWESYYYIQWIRAFNPNYWTYLVLAIYVLVLLFYIILAIIKKVSKSVNGEDIWDDDNWDDYE